MSPKKKKNGHPQDSDKPVESSEDQVTPESPEVESADDASTEQNDESGSTSQFGKLGEGTLLQRRMDENFLEYASYVIRDRAIPNLVDGLKPCLLYTSPSPRDQRGSRVGGWGWKK